MEEYKGKTVIGLLEEITIYSNNGKRKTLMAKIDTGATKSSIDINLASKLKLGPVIKSRMIKSAHGSKLRPVIEAHVKLAGKKMLSEFTLIDRVHMKYKALIGQATLKNGFIIDPSKE